MEKVCKYYYVANDGKEFETEKECFDYEINLLYGNAIKNKELQMFNQTRKKTTNVNDCYYLKCDSIEACELFIALSDEEGLPTPFIKGQYGNGLYEVKVGIWYYDISKEEWISLEDLENTAKEIKEIFK